MLKPLIDADDIKDTFNLLSEISMKGEELCYPLNFFGPEKTSNIFWHEEERIWVHSGCYENRYLVACGTDDPKTTSSSLEIICTFNPPIEGINRRCAGIFLHGSADKSYLGHSGNFPNFYKCVAEKELSGWAPVQWPDGQKSKVIVIGLVEETTLIADMGKFVHEVKRYKAKHRPNKA